MDWCGEVLDTVMRTARPEMNHLRRTIDDMCTRRPGEMGQEHMQYHPLRAAFPAWAAKLEQEAFHAGA